MFVTGLKSITTKKKNYTNLTVFVVVYKTFTQTLRAFLLEAYTQSLYFLIHILDVLIVPFRINTYNRVPTFIDYIDNWTLIDYRLYIEKALPISLFKPIFHVL